MAALTVEYDTINAGECCICLIAFDQEEVAIISCRHKLHPECIARLVLTSIIGEPQCPERCGNIPIGAVRTLGFTVNGDSDRWQGEDDLDHVEVLRHIRDSGASLSEDMSLRLQHAETSIEGRQRAIQAQEKIKARELQITEKRIGLSPKTHEALSDIQSAFYEANPTNTMYTSAVMGGGVRGAYLIRLLFFDPTKKAGDKYYVWVGKNDIIDDVARVWFEVLWGPLSSHERPSDWGPVFKHEQTLMWGAPLKLRMGDTIIHRII
ncbi:Nn.00g007670.m01.CDS01 [Neocucurbitaria sp. VM-36]